VLYLGLMPFSVCFFFGCNAHGLTHVLRAQKGGPPRARRAGRAWRAGRNLSLGIFAPTCMVVVTYLLSPQHASTDGMPWGGGPGLEYHVWFCDESDAMGGCPVLGL
jgi:hypothetical protein